MKIINVGTYPPPVGGVSSYLYRLNAILLKHKKDGFLIDISKTDSQSENILNMNEWTMFMKLLFFQKKAIVHFHIFSLKLNVLFFILSLRHYTIITFHNERFYELIRSRGKLIYFFQKFFLNSIFRLIVINAKCESLAKNFVKQPNKLILINNFIAPPFIPKITDPKILKLRSDHRIIISSNAWKICFHNGQDLYGIDILIEMMKSLATEFNVALLFALPEIGDEKYFIELNERINNYNLKNSFIFLTNALESGSSLWQISDLVIRATNTDGSSLTVLEALDLGTPVLASDCVERPDGTILFKTRDIKDLINKTREILSDVSAYKGKLKNNTINSEIDKLLNLYTDIINNNL